MHFKPIQNKKLISLAVSGAVLAGSFTGISSGTLSAADHVDVNFARALQYSIYFYDANMCGTEVGENTRYVWRDDCHVYDSQVPMNSTSTNLSESFLTQYKDILDPDGDGYIDVSGGFHDAGDHVKFGMPENYAASALGWGYYEFRDAYQKTGQADHIETILRYFNDYLMKCTFRDANGEVIAHCYQVGDGDIDHAYWNSPEIDDMARPAFFLTGNKPQTDYVVSAAASLAVNYLNFKDTDAAYAAQSLDYAKALFSFAQTHEKELSDNADGPKVYYRSEEWEDDYVWAAAWLYKATEDISYLEDAVNYINYYAPSGWVFCWNDTWSGALTLLGEIDIEHPELDLQNMYRNAKNITQYEDADFWLQIEKAIQTWMTNYNTPGGYAYRDKWGSARYNTAMQLVSLIYDKYKNNGKPSEYSQWAKSQMEYIMGDNPMNRCYIVGYSDISAKYPHHRAASGLTMAEDTREHRYVLYGALVGGPDGNDQHVDITADYVYNEVTIDYNAAFVGACAGLYTYFGTDDMEITPDFPPLPEISGEDEGGSSYWVEAFSIDITQEAPKANEITFYVRSNATKAAKDISVRYYFDAAGMSSVDPADMEIRELYDQMGMETDYKAALSGPHLYKDNIYYVEIRFDGYAIANSNKKYQFALGTYAWQNSWDPSDDWSYQDIKIETDSFTGTTERTDYICVYSDGVLVGGIEPDGTTPNVSVTTTATTASAETTTATVTTESVISGSEGDSSTGVPDTTTSSKDTSSTVGSDTTVRTTETVSVLSEFTSTSSLAPIPGNALLGDTNLDAHIDLTDVILLNKAVADAVKFNDVQLVNADCDRNGSIDTNDAIDLLRFLVHLIPELGASS